MSRNSDEIDLDITDKFPQITPKNGAVEAAKLFARDAIREDVFFGFEIAKMEREGVGASELKRRIVEHIVAQRRASEDAVARHLFATHATGTQTRLSAKSAFNATLKRIMPSFPIAFM